MHEIVFAVIPEPVVGDLKVSIPGITLQHFIAIGRRMLPFSQWEERRVTASMAWQRGKVRSTRIWGSKKETIPRGASPRFHALRGGCRVWLFVAQTAQRETFAKNALIARQGTDRARAIGQAIGDIVKKLLCRFRMGG